MNALVIIPQTPISTLGYTFTHLHLLLTFPTVWFHHIFAEEILRIKKQKIDTMKTKKKCERYCNANRSFNECRNS